MDMLSNSAKKNVSTDTRASLMFEVLHTNTSLNPDADVCTVMSSMKSVGTAIRDNVSKSVELVMNDEGSDVLSTKPFAGLGSKGTSEVVVAENVRLEGEEVKNTHGQYVPVNSLCIATAPASLPKASRLVSTISDIVDQKYIFAAEGCNLVVRLASASGKRLTHWLSLFMQMTSIGLVIKPV